MQSNTIAYAIQNNTYVLKMMGELRFSFAPSINEALKVINENKNIQEVIIDLTQTRSIDSTIIGTLLNFFLKEDVWSRFMTNPPRMVTRNPDVMKALMSIGLDMFFPISQDEPKLKNVALTFTEVSKISQDKNELEEYVKASHRTLSKLNPRSDFNDIVSHIKH